MSTESRHWLVAGFLCLLISFVGLANHDLWTPDEPRVAAISLEMSQNGDFIVPRLGGVPFVEKPPLYFALAAALLRITGEAFEPVGVIRASSTLWGIGLLLATFRLALLLARVRANHAQEGDSLADARPIDPQQSALIAAGLLATTATFIRSAHFIRVDIALACCVVAAVWAFAEVYLENRRSFLLPAGVFLAGAFMAKGMVGIMFVGIGWLALVLPWLKARYANGKFRDLSLGMHLGSLLLFVLLVGGWMALLRIVGGQDLWDEWFWRNQLGRMQGTAQLGHSRPGQPFYYIKNIFTHTLPWAPLLILWFWHALRDLWKRIRPSPERFFSLVWLVGSVVVLTLSVTKRGVYILPLIPMCIILCGETFERELPRTCKLFFGVWIALGLFVLGGLSIAPSLLPLLPVSLLDEHAHVVATWSFWNGACALGLLGSIVILVRGQTFAPVRLILLSELFFLGVITVAAPLDNQVKSMRAGTEQFTAAIDSKLRPRVAGYGFSETMRGLFYVYGEQWVPALVSEERLKRVVAGVDPDFDSAIINGDFSLPDLLQQAYAVRAEVNPSAIKKKRLLRWVAGDTTSGEGFPRKSNAPTTPTP